MIFAFDLNNEEHRKLLRNAAVMADLSDKVGMRQLYEIVTPEVVIALLDSFEAGKPMVKTETGGAK